METQLFPRPFPLPRTPAERPALVTVLDRAADGQQPLLSALVASTVGTAIRRRRRARRLAAVQHTLEQIGVSADQTRQAVTIVSLLPAPIAGNGRRRGAARVRLRPNMTTATRSPELEIVTSWKGKVRREQVGRGDRRGERKERDKQ